MMLSSPMSLALAARNGGAPTIDWSFLLGLPSSLTFTRASSATYFDSTGTLQKASSNTPRFDYAPGTLTTRGLLLEKSRTNMCLYSGYVGGTGWVNSNANVTANYASASDGTNAATQITATAQYGGSNRTISVSSNTTYTLSAWVKQISGASSLILQGFDGTAYNSASCNVGSSWTRITKTFTTGAAATALTVAFQDNAASSWGTYQVWGVQLEAGPSASSYIPTTGTAVTRAADSLSTTSIPWFNPKEGTMFVSANTLAASTVMLAEFNDNSFNNRVTCGEISGGSTSVSNIMFSEGISQGNIQTSRASATDTEHRVAHSWKLNQRFAARNGVLGTPDTTADMPVGITRLKFGDIAGGSSQYKINGTLRSFKYWNRALSASELQRITT